MQPYKHLKVKPSALLDISRTAPYKRWYKQILPKGTDSLLSVHLYPLYIIQPPQTFTVLLFVHQQLGKRITLVVVPPIWKLQ